MPEGSRPVPRVIVGAVMPVKSRTIEELGKAAAEDVRAAGFTLVRSVVVNGEKESVVQLISNVSNDNEADALLLIGGTGFGPRDATCEGVDEIVEHRIEGFAEAYRHLLRVTQEHGEHRSEGFAEAYRLRVTQELGANAWLSRATAGVYNQCLVFALTGRLPDVRAAVQQLIVPTLSDAVELATGRLRATQIRA
jgi:molybdopterin adenylyltransferase